MRWAATIVVLALAAVACRGSEESITVYSGRTENLIGPLLDAFTDETGISVAVKYGSFRTKRNTERALQSRIVGEILEAGQHHTIVFCVLAWLVSSQNDIRG